MTEKEMVDHPDHYNQGGIECIDALSEIGIATDFCRGNAIKYLWRIGAKTNDLEDAKKALWYTQRLIKEMKKHGKLPSTTKHDH